jgi:predicted RNase H-like nuclease (RuvC/YqgF family)
MDVTQVTTLGSFAEKFGFPALLVLTLMFGIWQMLKMHRDERDKREDRDEQRELARRSEREADRKAHVESLYANTQALGIHLTAIRDDVGKLDDKVERIDDKVDTLITQTRKP